MTLCHLASPGVHRSPNRPESPTQPADQTTRERTDQPDAETKSQVGQKVLHVMER